MILMTMTNLSKYKSIIIIDKSHVKYIIHVRSHKIDLFISERSNVSIHSSSVSGPLINSGSKT